MVIDTKWTRGLAYAIGLITTDGSLSKDGRHIDFTSKDIDQLINFNKALNSDFAINTKKSGSGKISYRIQFGDSAFYSFLVRIGLIPNKSKSISEVNIPDKYFFDFLRGHFDGDGSFYY